MRGQPEARLLDQFKDLYERAILQDNGGVESDVLIQSVALWKDVIERGGLVDAENNSAGRLRPARESLVAQLDVDLIDQALRALDGLELLDESAAPRVNLAFKLLDLFDRSLARVTTAASDPSLVIVDEGGQVDKARPYVTAWRSRCLLLRDVLMTMPTAERAAQRAREAAATAAEASSELEASTEKLRTLSAELSEARAEQARNTLATHFSSLAAREKTARNGFRVVTGLLLAVGLMPAFSASDANDVSAVVGHLGFVLVLGAAAAYSARLGAKHQLLSDWAQSIKVQLDTFQDFLAAVDDPSAKQHIYEEFGRRVLGPPPSSESGSDTILTGAQLIDLVTASRRKDG